MPNIFVVEKCAHDLYVVLRHFTLWGWGWRWGWGWGQ